MSTVSFAQLHFNNYIRVNVEGVEYLFEKKKYEEFKAALLAVLKNQIEAQRSAIIRPDSHIDVSFKYVTEESDPSVDSRYVWVILKDTLPVNYVVTVNGLYNGSHKHVEKRWFGKRHFVGFNIRIFVESSECIEEIKHLQDVNENKDLDHLGC